ncbi:MAG: HlyD family efflux transporter periplasmic adaptor subunit [Brachymonas sp.]|nr:HlyD family efflux transporter periplasmic adaptor subunit [Brachymonas sp.]
MNIAFSSRKTLMLAGGIAVLGGLLWLALRSPAQLASTGQVTRGPLEVAFQEEGKTRIKQRYVIAAPVAGTVRRITLQAGDAVQAGQTLAEIEPGASALLDPRARSQAQADVRSAEALLAAARKRSSAAQASQQLAQADWQRAQALQPSGAIARQELDQARSRHAAAQAELGVARADEQAAAARLAAARALLADEGRAASGSPAKEAGKVLAITAPVAGRIIRRPIESATPVPVGHTLMEMGDPSQLEIEVEVLSSDAVRLGPGMPARILRWGGEGTLQARIARIEPGGFTKVSALGVEEQRTRVILDLLSPHEQWAALGDGYRVEVEFIVQRANDVLQVPSNALFRHGEGWAVYRLENGKARHTPVQIGLRSALSTEVKSGLQAEQTVVIQPDERISDGSRIQASPAVGH